MCLHIRRCICDSVFHCAMHNKHVTFIMRCSLSAIPTSTYIPCHYYYCYIFIMIVIITIAHMHIHLFYIKILEICKYKLPNQDYPLEDIRYSYAVVVVLLFFVISFAFHASSLRFRGGTIIISSSSTTTNDDKKKSHEIRTICICFIILPNFFSLFFSLSAHL